MKKDLIEKIRTTLELYPSIGENDIRSLMILVRKCLERMPESERSQYLVLNLFCNWAVHTKITQSTTGLRILARINDILVKVKDINDLPKEMSDAIGFAALYSEFKLFFKQEGIAYDMSDKNIWRCIIIHLIEIIYDVPIAFPHVTQLKNTAKKIYNQIKQHPIKPGFGVISITLSKVDNSVYGINKTGSIICLKVLTENTTTIVIPLRIEL